MAKIYTFQLVVPCYNEEKTLESNILIIHKFLQKQLNCKWQISIADNGSNDQTCQIGKKLSIQYQRINYIRLSKRGRGNALKSVWSESCADIVGYIDADLSVDMQSIPSMIDLILNGNDIVVSSRLTEGANVKRGIFREILSRSYNIFVKRLLTTKSFSDAQCGCKVLRREVAQQLSAEIKNHNWFFDTELLVLAERRGFRIKELPINWTETKSSKVKILPTIYEDIKGVLRLRFK